MAPKNAYAAESYVKVLEEQIPLIYEPSKVFVYDNAPIYTARAAAQYLEDNAINVVPV